jgi:hypothetical protein
MRLAVDIIDAIRAAPAGGPAAMDEGRRSSPTNNVPLSEIAREAGSYTRE